MMQFLVAALLSWTILLFIICMTTVHLSVHFIRKGKDDLLTSNVKAWFGLIYFRIKIPVVSLAKDLSGTTYQTELESSQEPLDQKRCSLNPSKFLQAQQRIYQWMKDIHTLHKIVKTFFKHIRFDKLEWKTGMGTGNAAETGMLSGISWGIKSNIIGLMSSYFSMVTIPRIHIQPYFQEKKLETEIRCMIRIQIGYAILAGIRVLLNLKKRRDDKWRSTPFKV